MVASAGLSTTTATAASGNDGGVVLTSDGFYISAATVPIAIAAAQHQQMTRWTA